MTGTNIHDGGRGRYAGGETPTNDDHLATKKYVDDNGGTVDVTDGVVTVTGLTELDFVSGATVTDAGGGVAQVAVAGGGSQTLDDVLTAGNDGGGKDILNVGEIDFNSFDNNTAATITSFSDLNMNNHRLTGAEPGSYPDVSIVQFTTGDPTNGGGRVDLDGADGISGHSGGRIRMDAGRGDGGTYAGAHVQLNPGTAAADGKLEVASPGSNYGASGQALVSNGVGETVWGGLTIAAGVPVAAPDGALPFAYDTTAVTGGLYIWNGAAWVKVANII